MLFSLKKIIIRKFCIKIIVNNYYLSKILIIRNSRLNRIFIIRDFRKNIIVRNCYLLIRDSRNFNLRFT